MAVVVVMVTVLVEAMVLGSVMRKPLPRARNPMWV
jgi:hypothetical protein